MKAVATDDRSPLARRICERHYNAIGSIPPLPLWQVIDEETARLTAAHAAAQQRIVELQGALERIINLYVSGYLKPEADGHVRFDHALKQARLASATLSAPET